MTIFEAVILGLVQGLTVFFPVSNSAHFLLLQSLTGRKEPLLAFDIILPLGTLAAGLFYFRKDFFQMARQSFLFLLRLPNTPDRESLFREYPYALAGSCVILSSLPAVMVVLIFKDAIEAFFASVAVVGIAWIVLGAVLILSRRFQTGDRGLDLMNHQDAFVIGLAQGMSLVPGISRSGATLLAGMLCGIEKKEAARFSLWMSVPAMMGTVLFALKEKWDFLTITDPLALAAGFGVSALAGYFTIGLLLKWVERGKLFLFGFYDLAMGLLTLLYFFMPR